MINIYIHISEFVANVCFCEWFTKVSIWIPIFDTTNYCSIAVYNLFEMQLKHLKTILHAQVNIDFYLIYCNWQIVYLYNSLWY